MIDHPGLQGQILFQGNIIYNFEKGNLFRHFKTDYVNYPFGENLGFAIANSLHLFMYIPLKFFLGIIEAYNASVMIIFLLNFLAAYWLAKYLFPSRAVAFCSALVFALNSYVLLKLNMGFMQKFTLFWIPLYCLALFRLQNTKNWRYVFAAGVILSAMQLTYPPYAYYAIVFTFVLSLYAILKRDELKFIFTRFFIMIAFHLVFTFLIYNVMGLSSSYFRPSEIAVLDITTEGCLNLFRPFFFFPHHPPTFPTHLPLGISFVCFLCGVVAFLKKRGLARVLFLTFLTFLVISAGPYLTRGGQLVYLLGHKIILPYYIMAKYLPFARGIFFPIRLFPFINICLALLTGYGLLYFSSTVKKFKPTLVAILFSIVYLGENFVLFPQLFPPKISDINVPKFYQEIKSENFTAVLNLPVSPDREIVNRYGYYAVLSEKKMMNPYHREGLQIYLPKNADSQQQKKKFIKFLSDWNVGYVIVHKDFLKRGEYGEPVNEFSWLESFCEANFYPEDNLLAYKIPPFNEVAKRENVIYIPRDFSSIQKGIEEIKREISD